MKWLGDIAGGLIKPIAGIFQKKEERKKAVQVIRAQTAMASSAGETSVKLSNAQWDLISKKNESDTWKDEYITLLITSPLICIIVGNIAAVFFDDTRLLIANAESMKQLAAMGVDMGELMLYTVLAALGLKVIK